MKKVPVSREKAEGANALEKVRAIASPWKGREDMLIEVLREAQAVSGNGISRETAEVISEAMDIPCSKIYGVLTFYAFFSTKERGENIIRMCRSAPCHVMGAKAVVEAFEKELGIKVGETTPDKKFTLEFCECLGMCDNSPNIMINDKVYTHVSPEKVKEIVEEYRKGGAKKNG